MAEGTGRMAKGGEQWEQDKREEQYKGPGTIEIDIVPGLVI